MSQRNLIASAVGGSGLFLIGVCVSAGWMRSDEPLETNPATLPSDSEQVSNELRERNQEIEQLRAKVLRLEAQLTQQREIAAVTEALAGDEQASAESSAAEIPGDKIEAARIVLRALLPDRFGTMTTEELAALTHLDLHGSKATDADLAVLSALPSLSTISLRGTAVTDAGIGALSGLSQLTAIDLRDTQISGAGLALLPKHKLDALHLTGTRVTSDDMRRLPLMPDLRVLKLNRCNINDDGLRNLPYLPGLSHLELDGTQVTAAGLGDALAANRSLRRIEIRGTALDPEALKQLQEQHPGVEFVIDNPDARLGLLR